LHWIFALEPAFENLRVLCDGGREERDDGFLSLAEHCAGWFDVDYLAEFVGDSESFEAFL
jgi:hypothetical protein